MRILVTGSREWDSYSTVMLALFDAAWDAADVTVIHGGATGADSQAALVASIEGWRVEEHPAEWAKWGQNAGPKRNQEMVDAGADICLAFLKKGAANRGTRDCIGRAEAAGIPIRRIED